MSKKKPEKKRPAKQSTRTKVTGRSSIKKSEKKNGRPSKYRQEFCKQLIEFFDVEPYEITTEKFYYKNGDVKEKEVQVASPLPFFSTFARKIGVCVDTLNEWTKRHKDFSEAYKTAKEIQREILITNGLKGLYNATSYIFTAKNITEMRDRQEVVLTFDWRSLIKDGSNRPTN